MATQRERIDRMKKETMERIDPKLFRAYLKMQGWQSEGTFRDVEEYWEKDGYQISLPLGTDKLDYALRVGEAISTLSTSSGAVREHIAAMLATGRVKNWLIANLIEPDLEPLTEEEKDAINPPITTFSNSSRSPEKAHYIVTVWEEGDEPRWEPINFTGHFESAVWAYEQLYGEDGDLFLEKNGKQWMASNHIDVVHPPDQNKKACWGNSASEAICNLILDLDGILD